MSNLTYLFQRSYASSCLDVVKMKGLVPCEVEDEVTGYKGKITEIVFDPLKIPQVNARFEAAGYIIPEDFAVIALTADKRILLWGGVNSVYYLKKREKLAKSLEENMAFYDVVDLTGRFKTKNKKTEVDDLITQLKKVYSQSMTLTWANHALENGTRDKLFRFAKARTRPSRRGFIGSLSRAASVSLIR